MRANRPRESRTRSPRSPDPHRSEVAAAVAVVVVVVVVVVVAAAAGHLAVFHACGDVCQKYVSAILTTEYAPQLTARGYQTARRPCCSRGKDRVAPGYGSSRAYAPRVGQRLQTLQRKY